MAKLAIKKSILKEYDTDGVSMVYMNNDTEFQIMLFNNQSFIVKADIFINGEKLDGGGIVLKPGERIWLERYLNTPHKFLFSTYEVAADDTDVDKAIKDNGAVTIKFYKERKYDDHIKVWDGYHEFYYDYDYNNGSPKLYDANYFNSLPKYSIESNYSTPKVSSVLTGSADNICECKSTHIYDGDTCTFNTSTGELRVKGKLNLNYSKEYCLPENIDIKVNSLNLSEKTKETGRIDEGAYSSQKFKHVNYDFEYTCFKMLRFKILPMSEKPYTSNDLKKVYCQYCGRKLKDKFNFCPYCGNKLQW